MNHHFSIVNIIKRGFISGIIFTFIWACWAYFANIEYGEAAAIKASITQASFTMINAFAFTIVMEYLFFNSKGRVQQFILAYLLPNIITAALLYVIHSSRGTPNVISTITPSITVAAILSFIYVAIIGPKKQ